MDELSGSGDQDCSLEHPPDNAIATPVSFSTAGKGIIVQVSGEAYTKANKLLQAENVSYDSSGFCLKDKVAGSVASFEPSNISGKRQKVNTAGHGVGAKNSKLTIEDDVIIGAGSLVPPGKRLQSGFLYVGSPVKQVRELTDKEKAFFTYSAANYVKLKDLHLAEGYDQL